MFKSIVSKFTGDPAQRTMAKYQALVDEVNALEPEYQQMSDDELRAVTAEFRTELQESVKDLRARWEDARTTAQSEDDVEQRRQLDYDVKKIEDEYFKAVNAALTEFMPHAFAAVRESSRRTIGLRHFDVQLIGGAVLHEGKIAEMKTGEGKTLVATLPLYLNALAGHGVQPVTPNDYLSKVGVQWMGPIYHALGLTVQISGTTVDVMSYEPLDRRWEAFGWQVRRISGHDMDQIVAHATNIPFLQGQPSVVIANTIKSKGISFAEERSSTITGRQRMRGWR